MVKECLHGLMESDTKVNSEQERCMGQEDMNGLMENFTKETMRMTKRKDLEYIILRQGLNIEGISRTTSNLVKESTFRQTGKKRLEFGKTVNSRVP